MMDTLLRKLSSLPYKTDGIVFTPVNCGGVTGTHPTLFKLKSLHTVDVECTVPPLPPTLIIQSGASGCAADFKTYMGKGGGPATARERVELASLQVRNVSSSSDDGSYNPDFSAAFLSVELHPDFIQEYALALADCEGDLVRVAKTCIVETVVTISQGDSGDSASRRLTLRFHSLRTDKAHPNSWRTLEKTLLNMVENITPEEIWKKFSDSRSNSEGAVLPAS